ncbi:MAG: tRNA (N(6)-L-threonylcarbamoyladenosine(37)-C(2))-methylthiotransferase MtaB [Alphaproteobacteria bacterium]|nr:tRNA (N(6)-L-threonylcarbamoyladenosine(37)-C(2))-methylthiotransferase MtaB [Alphaproteobacteria bacterium]
MNRIITFGCRLNTLESEVIKKRLSDAGFDDMLVIHTCAITAEAERKAKQALRREVKSHAGKIIITGCGAQASADFYLDTPGVLAVIDNKVKLAAAAYVYLKTNAPAENPLHITKDLLRIHDDNALFPPLSFDGYHRAFVQIQKGCLWNCSYCIVPSIRGRHESFPREHVFSQIEAALDQGFKEIVLTGVDIASYGCDINSSIPELIKEIFGKYAGIKRLRLSSLDPARDHSKLIKLMSIEPRIMPHIHLSLQSGCDKILKSMNRRHTIKQVVEFITSARKALPHIVFGADIICGFPGETDEDFEITLKLIKEIGIIHLHAFAFSPRPGTLAATMKPTVDITIKKQRTNKFIEMANKTKNSHLKTLLDTTQTILLENKNRGYTPTYIEVQIEGEKIAPHTLQKVKITGIKNDALIGKAI